MTPRTKRSRNVIGVAAIILIVLGGIYWYVATDTFSDTADRKPEFTVDAIAFINEFRQDAEAANKKYADKIVAVNGTISALEMADTTVNVKMQDPQSASYIIFAFQQQHADEAKTLKEGQNVSIKGSCSGSVYSEIMEAYSISFKRSAINK